jgi:EAL domain-containing protein (putative c-di-GMP-specific phosphodiesterase class I)
MSRRAAAPLTPDAPREPRTPLRPHDQRATWRFHVLAEIVNFAALRRHVGRTRASLVCGDVAEVLRCAVPQARVSPIGHTLIELDFEGATPAALDEALDAARAAVAGPLSLDGEPHDVVLLFGVAMGHAHTDDIRLAEEAEAALVEARGSGEVVTHEVAERARGTRKLTAELQRAIARDELVLFYQPKVHARRQEIDSAEALVRWQHPERGLVLPGEFIPAAESGQLIDRLTIWTIERAIKDQRALLAEGHDLRLFINISGQLLADPAFVERACDLVVRSDAKLGFEVTETSVIRDPTSAIANLQRFADIGVRIAIDDYGAGLSSLAYLKQLPARELKIDKLFVTQLTSSNRDPLIVRSTIDLAHALDMEVVAEGVETHAALALLTVMGCDMVQGFLISRPISRDALVTFLAEDGNRRASLETRLSFSRLATAWKRG